MFFGSRFSVFFVCLVWASFSERGDITSVPKVALGCGWARFYLPILFCH